MTSTVCAVAVPPWRTHEASVPTSSVPPLPMIASHPDAPPPSASVAVTLARAFACRRSRRRALPSAKRRPSRGMIARGLAAAVRAAHELHAERVAIGRRVVELGVEARLAAVQVGLVRVVHEGRPRGTDGPPGRATEPQLGSS